MTAIDVTGVVTLVRVSTLILGLAAATTAQAEWSRKPGTELALGRNLAGEECRAVLERHDDDYDFAKHRIYCGAWTEPSGTLNSWTFKRNRTNRDWRDRRKYWWRPDIDRRFHCEAGDDSEILDGVNVATLNCITRTGGFPYLAYVGKIGRRVFFADMIPANTNVVATLSGIVSDKIEATEIEAGSTSRLVTALRTRAEGEAGLFYAADAFAGFSENYRLGRLLNHAKEHAAAVRAFTRALGYQESLLGIGHSATGETIARIGNDLRNQGLRPLALQRLDQAEALLAKSPNKSHMAELYVYRAYDATDQGDHAAAVDFAERAEDLRRDYWGRENSWVAHAIYAKATAQKDAGDLDAAEDSSEESLRIYESDLGAVHHWPANLHVRLAEIRSLQGDHAEALEHADSAVDIRRRLFGEGIAYAEALWVRAAVHRRAGSADLASADFTMSIDALTRTGLADRLGRASLDPDRMVAALSDAAEALGDETEGPLAAAILAATQLPRRGLSKRVISQMAARSAADDPGISALTRELQDLVGRRDDLRYDLGRASGRNPERRNSAREARWAEELAEAEQKIGDLSRTLQGSYPGYARLVNPPPLEQKDLAELLAADEAVIRFVVGRESTVAVLTTGRAMRVHVAGMGREVLADAVRVLRSALEDGGGEPFNMRRSHDLFTELFGPLAQSLTAVRHLFVVPDGPLASLPPSLFVTAPPPARRTQYHKASWLMDSLSVTVLPTIDALRQLRRVASVSSAPRPFLGIAAPDFTEKRAPAPSAQGCEVGSPGTPIPFGGALAPLPETAVEVSRIGAALGAAETDLMMGPNASEARLRALDLSAYRGISFATHGLLPSEVDCVSDPGLALTPGGTDHVDDDGYLSATEIFTLELDADWVLLSACNTGTVDGHLTGESLSSLTAGFFFAGARSVIASHWPVASDPTARLMTEMFTQADGVDRAEALRRSQRAMLSDDRLAHPVFWAPFVIYGDRG